MSDFNNLTKRRYREENKTVVQHSDAKCMQEIVEPRINSQVGGVSTTG